MAERAKHNCEDGEASDTEEKERGKQLLWADNGKTVGLRLRVVERDDVSAPVLLRKDEDPPVSYTLQYEGMLSP